MLRPGADVIADLGGLHGFMDWHRAILTDSGGYQVFSLEPKITDEGATFRSTYDGTTHLLTPESAVDIQVALGSDIQMVLDVCSPLPSSAPVAGRRGRPDGSVGRAGAAAVPAPSGRRIRPRGPLSQFGIVQGGVDPELRRDSAAPDRRDRLRGLRGRRAVGGGGRGR